MISHLSLRDFQSWRKLDLELAPITMIVGRGNTGKSAIVRAITYALTNQGGDGFIRFDAPQARVGIAFDDGLAVVWTKRRGAGAVYNMASPGEAAQEFTKTGQTVPPEVEAATRFRAIEVDKNYSVSPQLSQQFDKPFIVDESGSRTARILGKLTRLDVLVQAQVLCRRDRETTKRAGEQAQESVSYYGERLGALPDMAALRQAYLQARAQVQTARSLAEQSIEAAGAVLRYQEASAALALPVAAAAEALTAARAAVDRYEEARTARDDHAQAVVNHTDAALGLDSARELLAQNQRVYEEVCRKNGVCETCPWK